MNKSHEYDKILTRLTTILHRLYEGESLSVIELADEFNVSTKTVQRDFNERLIRFPIEKIGRRWRMKPGFRIEKMQDLDNLLTLDILQTIARGIGSEFARRSDAIFSKLKNGECAPIRSYVSFEDISSFAPLFKVIEEAIVNRRMLAFLYHKKRRRVLPYRIVNFDGYWYLLAKETDGVVKKFHVTEISEAKPLNMSFETDDRLKTLLEGALNAWFDPNQEPFVLHLLAKEPIVKYLKRRPLSPNQKILSEHPNGDIELTLNVTSVEEALMVLKSWIPDIAVIGPENVKKAFENELKKALNFQTGHDAL